MDNVKKTIQSEKGTRQINDILAIILVFGIAILGVYSIVKKREQDYGITYVAHLVSLGPLFFALAALNHMNDQISFSLLLNGSIYCSIGLATVCLTASSGQIRKYYLKRGATSLVGLLVSIVLSSVFSIGVMIHTLTSF